MSVDGPAVPAGWYPDPEYPGQQRFWDGVRWTDHRQPQVATAPPLPPLDSPIPLAPRTEDNTNAGIALALSIVGLVFCQVLSPVGMVLGRRELTRIDTTGLNRGARGLAQAAWIVGIIGTVILVVAVVLLILFLLVAVLAAESVSS